MSGYLIAASSILVALALILYNRRQTAQTMKRLDAMLTAAMDGSFSEKAFDESRLSALESRMAQYLASCTVSARNLQTQKNQISTLVSDISHQTKTPVANLLLYTQLLSEQPLTEQGRECVQALTTQTDKLQTLIDALVKTSRLETGILALHPEESDIAPIAERAVSQYIPKAQEKNIQLVLEQTAGRAVFDSKWTEEALCNLLDNAIKYTPEKGTVAINVKNYEMFSALCVSDTGPGIPEEEHAKIFSRFYRSPHAYQAQGVGIGLYLTRQIMERQGGYVKLNSTPGQGSIFSLYLPRNS